MGVCINERNKLSDSLIGGRKRIFANDVARTSFAGWKFFDNTHVHSFTFPTQPRACKLHISANTNGIFLMPFEWFTHCDCRFFFLVTRMKSTETRNPGDSHLICADPNNNCTIFFGKFPNHKKSAISQFGRKTKTHVPYQCIAANRFGWRGFFCRWHGFEWNLQLVNGRYLHILFE